MAKGHKKTQPEGLRNPELNSGQRKKEVFVLLFGNKGQRAFCAYANTFGQYATQR